METYIIVFREYFHVETMLTSMESSTVDEIKRRHFIGFYSKFKLGVKEIGFILLTIHFFFFCQHVIN